MTLALVNTQSLDETVKAIQAKLVAADESQGKSTRYRVQAGNMLLALRKRIEEDKEAGRDVKWWPWYRSKFGRSRRDAEKVMALADAHDPNAAAAAERDKAKLAMRKSRSRNAANVSRNHESKVAYILQLVEELSYDEREEFLAAIDERYS
jgi:hypothetical protein